MITTPNNEPAPDLEPADLSSPHPTDAEQLPPVVDTSIDNLRAAVHARAAHYLTPTDCPPDMIPQYAEAVFNLVESMMLKFRNGQREHGGDFRTIDGGPNLEEELIDAIHYGPILRQLQRGHIRITID
jgi:hypothetical protein